MKYKIGYAIAAIALLFASCTAIEDRTALGPVLSASQVKVQVVQKTVGSNTVSLVSKTEGAIIYWDFGTGIGHSSSTDDTVTFAQPFAGTFKIKYTAFCAGGTVTDSTTYTVAKNDPTYFSDPIWKLLCADDLQGKTWVFATDAKDFSSRIWGNGGYGGDFGPTWWGRTAADAADDNIDVNSQMIFDANGAKNFTVTVNGITAKGFFELKIGSADKQYTSDNKLWSYGKVIFTGTTIPHGISQNENKKVVYDFDIIKVTADELILCHQTATATGEGWYWHFKRKGFTF